MVNSKIVILALGLASMSPNNVLANESLTSEETPQEYAGELIAEYFPENARLMRAIARCESGLVHRDESGNLLRNNEGSTAQGLFQVLMSVHRGEMRRMGLDPDNDDDYMTYVQHLYETQGTSPWNESRRCWRTS